MSDGPPRLLAITGATGLLGSAFLRRTLAEEETLRVLALTRAPAAARRQGRLATLPADARRRLTFIQADLADLRLGREALGSLRQAEAWWHFAAATHLAPGAEAGRTAAAVNDEGTARLLEIVRDRGTAAPFFHVSTAYVAGRRRGGIGEEEPPAKEFRNAYEETKSRAEGHVRTHLSQGHPGAIFRPSVVMEAAPDGESSQLAELCGRAVFAALERGEREFVFRLPPDARVNLVSLEWVTRALGALGRTGGRARRTYHLTARRDTHFAEIAREIEARAPGFRVRFDPQARAEELAPASRVFDRLLGGMREYLEGGLRFDRRNTEADLSPALAQEAFDLPALVAGRFDALRSAAAAANDRVSVAPALSGQD